MSSSIPHRTKMLLQSWIPRRKVSATSPEIVKEIPAVDDSWSAHVVLISAILCQGFIEGIPLCFGIFENHYEHYQFPGYQRSSWIGVCAIGMLYVGAPLMTYLCDDRKIKPEKFIFAAWITSIIGMVAASFCKTINTLAITQGFLLGLSVLLIEMPGLIILNTWFVKRRGFAYGLLFSFADIFGTGFGYLARYTLGALGLRYTFLLFAGLVFVVPGISIWFFRARPTMPSHTVANDHTATITLDSPLADPHEAFNDQPPRRLFYLRPLFYVFIIMTCFQSFAYYIPSIYLPTYNMQVLANLIDCTTQNANLLSVFNLAQIPGEFLFGWLSDRMNIHFLAVLSSLIAALATFLLWAGLAGDISANLGSLMAFAGLFGGFGGGFLTLWGRMSSSFDDEAQAKRVYSILSLVRGLATFASGPISSATLKWGTRLSKERSQADGKVGLKTKYGVLILFVGACMTVATVAAALGYFVERWEENARKRKMGDTMTTHHEESAQPSSPSYAIEKNKGAVVAVEKSFQIDAEDVYHQQQHQQEKGKTTSSVVTAVETVDD